MKHRLVPFSPVEVRPVVPTGADRPNIQPTIMACEWPLCNQTFPGFWVGTLSRPPVDETTAPGRNCLSENELQPAVQLPAIEPIDPIAAKSVNYLALGKRPCS